MSKMLINWLHSPLILAYVILSLPHTAVAYCYRDGFGNYRCDSGLSNAARVGISMGIFALCLFIVICCFVRRRNATRAQNALYLKQQQAGGQQGTAPGQWGTASGPAPPYGYPQQPQYPAYPLGNYPQQAQPFQPGYQGGYTPPANPTVQEPPKAFDPNVAQPYAPPSGPPPSSSQPPPGYDVGLATGNYQKV